MNIELARFIWTHRNKPQFFKVVLRRMNVAGTSLQFSVYIQKRKTWIDISRFIAEIAEKKTVVQNGKIFVIAHGRGTDLVFSMLSDFLDMLSMKLKKEARAFPYESYIVL